MTEWPIDWRRVVDEAIRRRKVEGLSQRSLAELAGVSPPTVNAFEQGDITLRFAGVAAILQTLGMFTHAGAADPFDTFVYNARRRWDELVAPLPASDPGRQALGHSEQAYALGGIAPLTTPQKLRHVLSGIPKSSGWTPFWIPTRDELKPYIEDGLLECWLGKPDTHRHFNDPAHSDFWRVTRNGLAYIHRGLDEDGPSNLEPGTIFDVSLPIWRTAEVLLHARNLARALGGDSDTPVRFRARYLGLEGRELLSWAKPRARIILDGRYRARSSQVDLDVAFDLQRIEDGLEAVVFQALVPLYERFDGYALSPELVHAEIDELRRQPGFGVPSL